MRKYQEKEVVKKVEELVSVSCDRCQKEIDIEKDKHFSVTTSHNDWGNDSIESTEQFDFCSTECLLEDIADYYNEGGHLYEYEVTQIKN